MKIYTINQEITIHESIERVWEFFSNPLNLGLITPPNLNFQFIRGADDSTLYSGKIIEYRVSPILGIPIQWVTEITQVSQRQYFIDEQRFGPYRFWHHQHFFKETSAGIIVTDLVHYGLHGGIFGQVAHALFVKSQLENIFEFRQEVLRQLFPVI